ncbi:MAG: RsiG family protein [Actinomycetes bacterium]
MSAPIPGGRRRIDRVLAPGFADELGSLSLEELRERRDDATQEEVDLSYARRLLQGRLDLLRAETARRGAAPGAPAAGPASDGGSTTGAAASRDEALVARLTAILTDDHDDAPRGLGRHLDVEPSRVGEHQRAAEAAVADLSVSDPSALDDAGLAAAVDRFEGLERGVSDLRHQVQRVVDAIHAELGNRLGGGVSVSEDSL